MDRKERKRWESRKKRRLKEGEKSQEAVTYGVTKGQKGGRQGRGGRQKKGPH